MSLPPGNEINADDENESDEKELVPLFIKQSRKMKKKLMAALLRCSAAEDQTPAETLRSSIDSISNTIAALQEGTKTLSDLRSYHLHVSVLGSSVATSAIINLELTQNPHSHPLPLNHYIKVKPPIGEAVKTQMQAKAGTDTSFTKAFDFGERSTTTINLLCSGEFEFGIYRHPPSLSKAKPELVAIATAPIASLATRLSIALPLHFMRVDSQKSNFFFDLRLSVPMQLVASEDFEVDEIINVVPNDSPSVLN